MEKYGKHTVGSKYNQELDIKSIAVLIRADIKAQLPAVKASVRIERYSLGQAIHIEVKTQVPVYAYGRTMTEPAKALRAKVQAICDSYNYDDSDVMTDYFNVNFSTHIKLIDVLA